MSMIVKNIDNSGEPQKNTRLFKEINDYFYEENNNIFLTTIYNKLFMENNDVLYNTVKNIFEQISFISNSQQLNKEERNLVDKQTDFNENLEIVINQKFVDDEKQYRYSDLFDYYDCYIKIFNNDYSKCKKLLINSCKIYFSLKLLIDNNSHKNLGYLYNLLCKNISEAYEGAGCYILGCLNKSSISSIINFYDNQPLLEKEIKEIFKEYKDHRSKFNKEIIDNYCLLSINDKRYLIIRYPILNIEDCFQEIYLLINLNILDNNVTLRYIAYQLAVFRNKILNVFTNDFSSIIKPVYYEINKKNEKTTNIKLLHISDLHIIDKNSMYKDLINKYFNVKNNHLEDIDFILITGDIIQGSNTIDNVLDKYLCAFEQIERIAINILGYDWKKRVIIVPGNHDYCLNTELKSELKNREYNNSEPLDNVSTFVKFVYFQFISSIFMPIDLNKIEELKNDDLNKVINDFIEPYGIRFIALNSAGLSKWTRTNRVGYSRKICNVLKSFSNDNIINICLTHHTPLFTIDYFRDKHLELCSKKFNILCEDYTDFYYNNYGKLTYNPNLLNNINKRMLIITDSLSKEIDTVNNDYIDSLNDQIKINKFYKLMIKRKNIKIFLGGHEHTNRLYSDKGLNIYEIDKLFSQNNEARKSESFDINYGIMTINKKNISNPLKYDFYKNNEDITKDIINDTGNKNIKKI